jgi:alkylhydroperoxidase family enzyme
MSYVIERPRRLLPLSALIALCWCSLVLPVRSDEESMNLPLLSNSQAWERLPAARVGQGASLPTWARILSSELPRSTAALLQLDYAQRTQGPVPLGLRAGMRWVAAHANGAKYAEVQALADARRAGVDDDRIAGLGKDGYPGWTDEERRALDFARNMSVGSSEVSDAEFADLVSGFGDRASASMVLLMAYSNFQDRLLICLQVTPAGAEAPAAEIDFDLEVLARTGEPPTGLPPWPKSNGTNDVPPDQDWSRVSYESLQDKLEVQRQKPTRLRIPEWREFAASLPNGLFDRPSDIVWYRIVFGYAPELAIPFEVYLRTAGSEIGPRWNGMFGGSLFWVVTRGIDCPYCMGHCEMNWEVAGMKPDQIALHSQRLAGNDWSNFSPAEQHALAFGRKLTKSPAEITPQEIDQIYSEFGPQRAAPILLNASRYHYMTRISNGFQLTLESENVFYDYYNVRRPISEPPPVPVLSDEEAWKALPPAKEGGGQPLPIWARAVAGRLPRTAVAMLHLDVAQRTKSPLDPVLRAKMRWVVAHANRCDYTQAYALADLKREGASDAEIKTLTGPSANWPEADQEPLEFARLLTVAAPTIPDSLFESLRKRLGDKQVASMVLLAAYGNFQDRFILGLNLPMEEKGPLAPVKVAFEGDVLQLAPFVPPNNPLPVLRKEGDTVVPEAEDWATTSYDTLQQRLESQRDRKPRLPIPAWEDVKKGLPPAMAARPTKIVWNLVCSGYVPELAVPWSISTRTLWTEAPQDRVLEESLFWIQTRAIGCNYCMGHCEMLLEVAGLDKPQIAERTALLAGADWSAFSPQEQRAYAYARKLSRTPWDLTPDDYRVLEKDYGEKEALSLYWWLCRGLYMTRISDGFQLPLERENVFSGMRPQPMGEKK